MFKLIRDTGIRAQALKYLKPIKCERTLAGSSSNQEVVSAADVVIVGGGIAGSNLLYQLAKRGVNAVLLERATITSGTTWHTGGLVWSLRPSDLEVNLLRDSISVYNSLQNEVEDYAGWINNGGMFISRSKIRTQEYMRLHTLGNAMGIKSEILDPNEAQKLFPLLDPSVFQMALYVYENCPILDIHYSHNALGNKEVTGVYTDKGIIKTKCVVNCGGVWGPRIARFAGIPSLPLVPDNLQFHLYELDWDIFGVHLSSASSLCPKLGEVGIKSTICGPESFTPDHKPLLGEDPNLYGLYHNCGYNSAGMIPSLNMFTFDIRRFTPAQMSRAHWMRESSHEAFTPTNKVVYSLLLNEKGGVEADVTVSILDGGSGQLHEPIFKGRGYYVVTSGFNANHTLAHLRRIIQTRKLRANITDVSKQLCILSVQGPNSQRILQRFTNAGLSNDAFPVNTHRSIQVSKAPYSAENKLFTCRALRVAWSGELGWELHVPSASAVQVYRALAASKDLRNAGWRALTSLSAEKGYHLWNADLRSDDNPVEANLTFTCRKNGEYIGNEQVDKFLKNGVTKKYAYFTLEDKIPLFGQEAIYRNGVPVGYLRRGEYAYYLDKPIGIGYVTNKGSIVTKDYLKSGEYEVEVMGKKHKATFHFKSPFDPSGQRLLGNYGDQGMDENTHEPHAGQNERAGGSE
ncbi:hypothetical protein O3G_MSEX005038 [Manduca sexta]|uniref:Sarcosine dehydrogenase, mitochondrial n=1 Tax=Manduca sexta TaxID=7130 RepID=A0A922CHZ5_MANSE|nr:hypothetical protein O3G_MSEX005038 [Manduca sexta]